MTMKGVRSPRALQVRSTAPGDPLHIAVVLDGVVLGQVFDAEAAAQVEDLELPARLRLHVRHEAEHHLGGVLERLDVKDLRADVAVDALEADPLHADGLPDRLHRLARLEREAELAVDLAGAHEVVGVPRRCPA